MTTFFAGQRLRASQLQAVSDTADLALKPPMCHVTRSTAQTGIATSTPTPIVFDTEVFDNLAMFSASSSTITIKRAGQYLIEAYAAIESNATGYRRLLLYKNGSGFIIDQRPAVTGDATHMTASGFYDLAVNDTIQLYIEHSSGANRSTAGTPRLAVTYQSA
jgi:hypothetical protein